MAAYGVYDIFDLRELEKEELKHKNRHWVEIVYPESAPDDWIERLRGLHLPFAISPLHDKDINETGEAKKAHYHVIFSFDGPTTYKNANNVIQSVTNGTIVKPCYSLRGSFRYLFHLDNPEKHQYDQKDVQLFNNFDVQLTDADEDAIKRAIFNIIIVNQIYEFAELCFVLEYEFGPIYSRVARRNHNYISSVITSFRHSPAPVYKRLLAYMSEEEFDLYALGEPYKFASQRDSIEELVKVYNCKSERSK